MNPGKYQQIFFSLMISMVLIAGVLVVMNRTALIVHAEPLDLFVTPSGDGDCSQSNPCDLPTSLSIANSGDSIYVAGGTYTGSGTAVVTITKSLALYGGWDGSPSGPILRDPEAYLTTLDGDYQRRGIYISGLITTTVDGFHITGGSAFNLGGFGDNDAGGGIFAENANVMITNNHINRNHASYDEVSTSFGGGIFLSGPYINNLTAEINNNQFIENKANRYKSGDGGGIAIQQINTVSIKNNVFANNLSGTTSNSMGGGVYLHYCHAVVYGNVFQSNNVSEEATDPGNGYGGGLYMEFGTASINDNTWFDNESDSGAITLEYVGTFTMTNNILAQNTEGGLSIRGRSDDPVMGTLVNNTIAENDSFGIYSGWSNSGFVTLTMVNNIISDHTTGIYIYTTSQGSSTNVITASHTLFYGNEYNITGSSITSENEISGLDPDFVDPEGLNYHLWADSPAIDAGLTISWLNTDIDGDQRPWPLGGAYDIGADETHWWQTFTPIIVKNYD